MMYKYRVIETKKGFLTQGRMRFSGTWWTRDHSDGQYWGGVQKHSYSKTRQGAIDRIDDVVWKSSKSLFKPKYYEAFLYGLAGALGYLICQFLYNLALGAL